MSGQLPDREPSAREALDRLHSHDRQLLWCRFAEGRSLAATARSLHVTVNFARVLQLRALRALQREQAHADARLAATLAVPAPTPPPQSEPGAAARGR